MTNGQRALARVIESIKAAAGSDVPSEELAAGLWDDFRAAVTFAANEAREDERREFRRQIHEKLRY
jgi:hypothetical protein